MTTLAYKEGYIAIDGRCVANSCIVDDDMHKVIFDTGYYFFLCGVTHHTKELVKAFFKTSFSSDDQNFWKSLKAGAFVWTPEATLLEITFTEAFGFCRNDNRLDHHYAAGSGTDFALAAMDHGKSAEEAVIYAGTRDIYTGGKTRVFECFSRKFIQPKS